MKSIHHFRARSAALIVAVFLVFGGIAEAGPAVLCIGDDGHTDIEYSLAGCCVVTFEQTEHSGSGSKIAGRNGCDDCVDLGLDQSLLKTGKRFLPSPDVTEIRVTLPESGVGGAYAPAAARIVDHESLTTALSSIVLLI